MSFKRTVTKSSADIPIPVVADRIAGVKPWIDNQYFGSSGLRQLDEIIGGGSAFGTLCGIEEDHSSNYAQVILNYSIVEALSLAHPCLLIVRTKSEALKILEQLPFNLNYNVVAENALNENLAEDASNWIEHNENSFPIESVSNNKPIEFIAPGGYDSVSQTGVVYCNSFDLSKRLMMLIFF